MKNPLRPTKAELTRSHVKPKWQTFEVLSEDPDAPGSDEYQADVSWPTSSLKAEDVERLVREMLDLCTTAEGKPFTCTMVNKSLAGGTLLCGTVMLAAEHLIWQLSGLKLAGYDEATNTEICWVPISAEPINTEGLIPGLRGEQDPAVKDEIDWTQYASVGEVPLRMVPDLVDPIDKKDSAEYVNLMALMEFFP